MLRALQSCTDIEAAAAQAASPRLDGLIIAALQKDKTGVAPQLLKEVALATRVALEHAHNREEHHLLELAHREGLLVPTELCLCLARLCHRLTGRMTHLSHLSLEACWSHKYPPQAGGAVAGTCTEPQCSACVPENNCLGQCSRTSEYLMSSRAHCSCGSLDGSHRHHSR